MHGIDPTADALTAVGIGIEFGVSDAGAGGIEGVVVGCPHVAPFAQRDGAAFIAYFDCVGIGIFGLQKVGRGLPCGIGARIGAGCGLLVGRMRGALRGAVLTSTRLRSVVATSAVTALALRRFGPKGFVETGFVPVERPRQTGGSHGQQEDKGVGAADGVEVEPAAMPAAAQMDGELFAQAAGGAGPKGDEAADEHEEEHEGAHAHDELAPPNAFAFVGEVEQPAVELEHGLEEGEVFLLAGHASRVGIDEPLGARRSREAELVVACAVGGNAYARDGDAGSQVGLHALHEHGQRQPPLARDVRFVAIVVGPFRKFAGKLDHRSRETDQEENEAEGKGEPEMETLECFFHVREGLRSKCREGAPITEVMARRSGKVAKIRP